MAKRLNTYVHVVDQTPEGVKAGRAGMFGPDDKVPDWAVAAILNPDVWADGPDVPDEVDHDEVADLRRRLAEAEAKLAEQAPVGTKVPPRHGAGSGREPWSAYATANGVEVTSDMKVADIVAACELAGVPVE